MEKLTPKVVEQLIALANTLTPEVVEKLLQGGIGEKPTNKKVNMAKELKIKILSQKQWKEMLD